MPASSFLLGLSTLSYLSLYISTSSASPLSARALRYNLVKQYAGRTFFDDWNFFTGNDPTHGYVDYVDRQTASDLNLIDFDSSGAAKIWVDAKNTVTSGRGRKSLRLESADNWTKGLFVADIAHLPGSICGTWPAWWTLGAGQWPYSGEIDIIEGANLQAGNLMTLHTGSDSVIANPGSLSGSVVSANCNWALPNNLFNYQGCSISDASTTSYSTFNGGTWAMEWTDVTIKVWFWPSGSVPSSISNNSPDTSTFGTPAAHFGNSLNVPRNFKNHRMIFDNTFCGDWAGQTWGSINDPNTCAGKTQFASCVDYVASRPAAFTEAYWLVNSVKVFQLKEGVATSTTTSTAARTTTSTTSSTISRTTAAASSTTSSSTGAATSNTTSTTRSSTAPTLTPSTSSQSSSASLTSSATTTPSPSSTPSVNPTLVPTFSTAVLPTASTITQSSFSVGPNPSSTPSSSASLSVSPGNFGQASSSTTETSSTQTITVDTTSVAPSTSDITTAETSTTDASTTIASTSPSGTVDTTSTPISTAETSSTDSGSTGSTTTGASTTETSTTDTTTSDCDETITTTITVDPTAIPSSKYAVSTTTSECDESTSTTITVDPTATPSSKYAVSTTTSECDESTTMIDLTAVRSSKYATDISSASSPSIKPQGFYGSATPSITYSRDPWSAIASAIKPDGSNSEEITTTYITSTITKTVTVYGSKGYETQTIVSVMSIPVTTKYNAVPTTSSKSVQVSGSSYAVKPSDTWQAWGKNATTPSVAANPIKTYQGAASLRSIDMILALFAVVAGLVVVA